MIMGGLPPAIHLPAAAETTYTKLFQRVVQQNRKFYRRFPQDIAVVQELVRKILDAPGEKLGLPRGGVLSVRGLQALGIKLGFNHGAESLHYLLEEAFDPDGEISQVFLTEFEAMLSYDTNPLYVLLHESIYCNKGGSSGWAAEVAYQSNLPLFSPAAALNEGREVMFTGEMMFPFMLNEFSLFKNVASTGTLLAERVWDQDLYDLEKLRQCEVPVAAAVYVEDMYVDYDLSMQTAGVIGEHSGCPPRLFITNEYLHSGIREDGERILGKLMGFIDGSDPER